MPSIAKTVGDSGVTILAPGLLEQSWSEADAIGTAIWLWMHSAAHRDLPLHALNVLLMPAIQRRQFVIASMEGRPVFYMAWANFDADAEQDYIDRHPLLMPVQNWNCGDRMWVLDWIAPFGNTRAMHRLVLSQLFPNRCFRSLHHRGNADGILIREFRGMAVLRDEARWWFETHPVSSLSPIQPKT